MLRMSPHVLSCVKDLPWFQGERRVSDVVVGLVGVVTEGPMTGEYRLGTVIQDPIKEFDFSYLDSEDYDFQAETRSGYDVKIYNFSQGDICIWQTHLEDPAKDGERYVIDYSPKRRERSRLYLVTESEAFKILGAIVRGYHGRLTKIERLSSDFPNDQVLHRFIGKVES